MLPPKPSTSLEKIRWKKQQPPEWWEANKEVQRAPLGEGGDLLPLRWACDQRGDICAAAARAPCPKFGKSSNPLCFNCLHALRSSGEGLRGTGAAVQELKARSRAATDFEMNADEENDDHHGLSSGAEQNKSFVSNVASSSGVPPDGKAGPSRSLSEEDQRVVYLSQTFGRPALHRRCGGPVHLRCGGPRSLR